MQHIQKYSAITAAAILILYWLIGFYDAALRDTRFFDGWVLFFGMGIQFLFHFRKKLPNMALGDAATWMQAHLYIGYFLIAGFGFHTSFSLPDGSLEWALWLLFVIVALSGLVGTYVTWSIPEKLEHYPERIVFETMPAFRSELARKVDMLAAHSVSQVGTRSISDLYVKTLREFFKKPQNISSHLRSSRRPLKHLFSKIENIERYVDESGKETLRSIKDLVVRKDALDYQYAQQWLLQAWLFVHIPATYSLIILTIFHVATIYAYSSGAP